MLRVIVTVFEQGFHGEFFGAEENSEARMERPIGIEPTPEPWQLCANGASGTYRHFQEHFVAFRARRNA